MMSLRIAAACGALTASLYLGGCAVQSSETANAVQDGVALRGVVHGGQQPITGALVQLYAAGNSGYGSASTPLIASTVVTDSTGSFAISGGYTCPSASTQVYLVTTGGNPGLGSTNPNIAGMAALGSCGSLTPSTFININELTTVASVWSLARFMTGYANVGTTATNASGLANAFAAVNKVVSIASGTIPGSALPAGATLPSSEINTIANILAACINSTGGTAGDTSSCGELFTAATPAGGTAPTNTISAAANIAKNPSANLPAMFALMGATPPFQPTLASAPDNFLIGISYMGGGLSTPKALAMDAGGNVWLANSGNSSVTELSNTGAAISSVAGFTGGGLSAPVALAIDLTGNAWVANGNSSVSKLSSSGTPVTSTAYTGGGLSSPTSVAVDGNGNVWLANSGTSSVTELNSSGVAVSSAAGDTGGGISHPVGLAVNPH